MITQFQGTSIEAQVEPIEPINVVYNPTKFAVIGYSELPDGTFLVHTESTESEVSTSGAYSFYTRKRGQVMTAEQINSVFGSYDIRRQGNSVNWAVVEQLLNAAGLKLKA